MAYAEGQLNGARDYRVGLTVNYSGVQNYGTNQSRFDWAVELIDAASWGSWTNGTCYWSASIGGVNYSGTFTIPSSTAGQQRRTVGSGSTWHSHDAAGFRSAFASSAYINANVHSNIGEGGSGNVSVSAPRIPKVPAAPAAPTISNVMPTTLTVSWSAPDNMGAGITNYQVQRATNSAFTTGVVTVSDPASPAAITGLTPGTDYWFRVRAYNSQGWGAWGASTSAKTLSGMYVWNGSTWRPGEVYVWDGTAWKVGLVYAWKGSAWTLAS